MEKLKFIDTHTHLYDVAFNDDFNDVIARIKNAGVEACILPGIDMESYENETLCAQKCRGFAFEAMGLHPTSVNDNYKVELDFTLDKLYTRNTHNDINKYIAVGEIGLDGYWSQEFLDEQVVCFKEQVLAAAELDLPVIIHMRECTDLMISTLESLKGVKIRGVLHAFSSSFEMYERLSKYGDFYVGIGGVVTYKNAQVAKSLENIPLERILLETDAPWLTPVPFRGKRNESTYIPYIAEKIAQIKGLNIEQVASKTTKNALSLFTLNL